MTTVATMGIFDYEIHQGHKELFNYCHSLGDKLVVFLVDDITAEQIKRKPYYHQYKRMENLVSYADEIMLLYGSDQNQLDIINHHPVDIWVFGPDQTRPFDKMLEDQLTCEIVRYSKSKKIASTSELLKEIGYIK